MWKTIDLNSLNLGAIFISPSHGATAKAEATEKSPQSNLRVFSSPPPALIRLVSQVCQPNE